MLVVPANDTNGNVASEVTIDYDESMDVGKIFADRCRERRDTSEGIIAIEVLICLMKCRNIRTVQGLDEMVNDAVKKLQQTDESNCSVKSACDIFQHFITMANLDETLSYEQLKKMLLDRARMYLRKMRGFRDNIARNTNHLIGSNFKLLTHAKSRNVVHSLSYIVNNEKNPRALHCYVTQSMPSKSGELMVKELTKHGVSCTLIPDTAVGYVMPEIDAVVLGAEAVVESGGVLNALGSCSVAMIACTLRKPVYVLVESFKFLRVYPFNQSYIPDELKWKHHKQSKTPSITDKPMDVEKDTERVPTMASTSKYESWVNIKNPSSKKLKTEVPTIDYTSPTYITALITDLGILDTAAVSDQLINLYT
nr:translation initiation factor eIF 2B subunit [Hymenolepis microstoma]